MIVTDPAEFLAAYSPERFPVRAAATARAAFLVAPAGATLAAESASDNRYMDLGESFDVSRALAQHVELARRLGEDVPVVSFAGSADCPDGMFPNNVFGTAPGRFIVGRMRHAVRQREAERADVRAFFRDTLGYRLVDFSQETFVAELTGSLVIDRARGIGYCGLSERCDLAGARAMHEAFGLDDVLLRACRRRVPHERRAGAARKPHGAARALGLPRPGRAGGDRARIWKQCGSARSCAEKRFLG